MNADEILDELHRELPDIPPDQRVTHIQARLRAIDDDYERGLAEATIGLMLDFGLPALNRDRVVAMIHGIRTHAVWFEKLDRALAREANVRVLSVKYGYFDLFCFWFPIPWLRYIPYRKTDRQLKRVRADYSHDDLIIVAHSFGTYLVSKLLLRNPEFRLKRLLMCGAIVPENYPWEAIPNLPEETPLNDCGTRDYLPMLAKTVTFGYGSSGTVGFNSHLVANRYFDFGHSGFFEESVIDDYWIPYLLNGEIVGSDWGGDRRPPPWFASIASLFQGQLLIVVVLVVALFLWPF